jgi:tetratricopeptide (TPR) repeat protein
MTSGHFGRTRIYVAVRSLALIVFCSAGWTQPLPPVGGIVVQGNVRDADGRPVVNAIISLLFQPASGAQTITTPIQTTVTDLAGAYRFAAIRAGTYTLHAELKGLGEANFGPIVLAEKDAKSIDLALRSPDASQKLGAQVPEFYDEPQFTVAGMTQATNSGGHGSDTVLRTTEALAKATVTLSKESSRISTVPTAAEESSLRDAVVHDPKDSTLHHRLGDVEEKRGNPLEAVREYQLAAELDPTEPNLFDWGTELLTHRALEPATEVFTKGNRLFPRSVRMLVALGVAWYARGSYEQASQCLANASDLAPDDPTPYLFLGRMQTVEKTAPQTSREKLARFAQLQPENALANYYYAIILRKQWASAADGDGNNYIERSARAEPLLLKAVRLDPKLGQAYLQLGILYTERGDSARAIAAYQKAIEVSRGEVSSQVDETLAETHYRLAQAYLRNGDKAVAQEQFQLHDQIAKKIKEDTERERREIQGFMISLRNKDPASQP